MDDAAEEGAGGEDDLGREEPLARARDDAAHPLARRAAARRRRVEHDHVLHQAWWASAVVDAQDHLEHRRAVEVAVGLGARALDGGTLAPVEDAEVDRLVITRPMSPSSASTSRTKCPLPMPPIDGLHDISPIVS